MPAVTLDDAIEELIEEENAKKTEYTYRKS